MRTVLQYGWTGYLILFHLISILKWIPNLVTGFSYLKVFRKFYIREYTFSAVDFMIPKYRSCISKEILAFELKCAVSINHTSNFEDL